MRNYFQDSSSFSFRRCLPSGWTFLLFSGIVTLVSEKIFLDPDDFWRTFSIHFLVGITTFMLAAFIIYRRERTFINNIIRFREHADWRIKSHSSQSKNFTINYLMEKKIAFRSSMHVDNSLLHLKAKVNTFTRYEGTLFWCFHELVHVPFSLAIIFAWCCKHACWHLRIVLVQIVDLNFPIEKDEKAIKRPHSF